jgi:protein-disulfide isomerase
LTKTILLLAAASLALTGCGEAGGKAGSGAAASAGENAAAAVSPAGTDWTTTVVATPEGGMRMGSPDAPVKLVEFASMTCHVCKEFSDQASRPLEQDYIRGGQVSYEFRNFVRDPIDIAASLLARCGGPAPFFKLTEQLFGEQDALLQRAQAISPADVKSLEGLSTSQEIVRLAQLTGLDKFAGMRGIPAAKANACLGNEAEINGLVARTANAAKQYTIPGTPTFLINGKVVDAPPQTEPWAYLKPALDAAIR